MARDAGERAVNARTEAGHEAPAAEEVRASATVDLRRVPLPHEIETLLRKHAANPSGPCFDVIGALGFETFARLADAVELEDRAALKKLRAIVDTIDGAMSALGEFPRLNLFDADTPADMMPCASAVADLPPPEVTDRLRQFAALWRAWLAEHRNG